MTKEIKAEKETKEIKETIEPKAEKETIEPKTQIEQQGITNINDPRVQFVNKKDRKRLKLEIETKNLKENYERHATKVISRGLMAKVSRKGGGIVLHIPKDHMPLNGLMLTISNSDLNDYLENGTDVIPVWEIVNKHEAEETESEQKDNNTINN